MLKMSFEKQCSTYQQSIKDFTQKRGWTPKKIRVDCQACENCKTGALVAAGTLVEAPDFVEWITIDSYHASVKKEKETQQIVAQQQTAVRAAEAETTVITTKAAAHVPKHTTHKINADSVREIRSIYAAGEHTQQQLADMFNTSRRNVGHIVTRKTWKSVT